jgi:cell division protein FtsQ
VAKTNPYNQRQSAALAFDEEQAEDYPRTADTGYRGQPRAADSNGASRGRRRAPIRQSRWADFRWSRFLFRTRIGFALLCACLIAGAVLLVLGYRQVRGFVEADPHFRIASSGSIQIAGAADADQGGLTRADLLSVFASDIGRNIFFVPLRKRQAQLEQLPWVAHATVMRLLPDHLSVSVVERVPIAFVRLGSRIGLVDADGVLLSLPPSILASRHYSFPVVAGLAPQDAPEARAARMQLYQRFVAELDSAGEPVSSQLSEVDLSDIEDVRAVVPAQGSDILLHFGDSDFLTRYRSYQAHLAEWRQQYPHLSAIDLRYDRQVVLKMADGAESEASSVDHGNSLTAAPLTAAAHPAHHPAGHGSAHGWRPE